MTLTAARQLGGGAAGAFAAHALVLRPRIQWLGTSKEERTATYPGDDLIPNGRRYDAMATPHRRVEIFGGVEPVQLVAEPHEHVVRVEQPDRGG